MWVSSMTSTRRCGGGGSDDGGSVSSASHSNARATTNVRDVPASTWNVLLRVGTAIVLLNTVGLITLVCADTIQYPVTAPFGSVIPSGKRCHLLTISSLFVYLIEPREQHYLDHPINWKRSNVYTHTHTWKAALINWHFTVSAFHFGNTTMIATTKAPCGSRLHWWFAICYSQFGHLIGLNFQQQQQLRWMNQQFLP